MATSASRRRRGSASSPSILDDATDSARSRKGAEPSRPTCDLLDRWALELFDREVRTIARTVLAGVVAADPAVFRRSSRTHALVAGILAFLIARLTSRMGPADRRAIPWAVSTQKELADATGVPASTIGARSRTVGKVAARADIPWPANLHSSQRAEAIAVKRQINEWRSERPS